MSNMNITIKNRIFRRRLLLIGAIFVVTITISLLMMPAVTLERIPTCGQVEHAHTRECFLICGQEEGHVHTDVCFEDVIVCGQGGEEGHRHTKECVQRVQVCTQEEKHVHTDACYSLTGPVCGLAEHVHTDACYQETPNQEDKDRFADSVSATAEEATGSESRLEKHAEEERSATGEEAASMGEASSVQTEGTNGTEENLLTATDDEALAATEGEAAPAETATCDEAQAEVNATLDEATPGECSPDEAAPLEEPEEAATLDEATPSEPAGRTLTYRDEKYAVSVFLGRDSLVPENAELQVTELTEGEQYEACMESIRSELGDISGAQLLDICILSDGEKVEPSSRVRVQIRSFEQLKGKRQIIHFMEEEASVPAENEATPSEPVQMEKAKLRLVSRSAMESVPAREQLPRFERMNAVEDGEELVFETEHFSVYGIVYTVDFHWEADGKVYTFNIPGGGFVSLEHLVEALEIPVNGSKETISLSGGQEEEEDSITNLSDEAGKNLDVSVNSTADEAITGEGLSTLNDIPVSETTKAFVACVESVIFSKPELIWVGKVNSKTTVGTLKEDNELVVQYSADLTEEQIAEINTHMVEAGDWALISVMPFDTPETLTITMNNGDQFVLRITDASYTAFKTADLDGKTVALVNLRNNNALQSTAHGVQGRLNAAGITYNASINKLETDDPNEILTKWTFVKVPNTQDRYYVSSYNGYLNINGSSLSVTNTPQELQIQQKTDGTIRIQRNNYAVNNHSNQTGNGYFGYQNGGNNNTGEWLTVFMLDTIALNPMNENGILSGNPDSGNVTSTHYKNMTIDGYTIDNNNDANLAMSRIYIPVEYNNSGTATVTLPSHSQLGNFSVSSADPLTHSITQDPNKYQWKLHGWINIATGEYYDVTGGPATATVSSSGLNVFYADWWAADYSYTIPEERRADTVDTSSFVTIKMFDYNEMFNIHGSDVWKVDGDARRYIPRDSLESEEWYIKNGPFFQFVDNTDPENGWQYGTLGNTQDRGRYNQWSNYSYSGTLGILGSQGQVPSTGVLERLFSEGNAPGSGVNYLGQGNYLFSYDEATKTYSYDSSKNAAVYNQNGQRFYVGNTDKRYYRGPGYYESSVGGFFPLNDYEKTLSYNNGTTNNWLGISIDLDFWLPDTPGSSDNANKIADHPMRFEFNGDDDVWVLIDGKLALDIGGIHEAVGGYIDFSTGEIRNAKGNTYQLRDMGIGAGAHKLSFYYLEQGGNASNCKITFNIVPRWVEEPVKKGFVDVKKAWSADTPDKVKEALSFMLMTEGNVVEGSAVGYADGTVDSDGVWKYEWKGLDPGKSYDVIETTDPRFQVSSQRIDGTNVTNVWAVANYHKDDAFGSTTILLGNDRTSSQGGKLLQNSGSTVAANIEYNIVESSVDDQVKWTVEGYTMDDQHFYLKNSSGQYLSIKNGSTTTVSTQQNASWFYMSPSGDLNDANSKYRLKADAQTGEIGVGESVNSADDTDTNSADRIHIYTYFDVYTKSVTFEYVNTYIATQAEAHKLWSNANNTDTAPDNASVTLELLANGQLTGKQVKLNGKVDVAANPSESQETITASGNSEDAYENSPWGALWDKLPTHECNSDGTAGEIIKYTVQEITESIPEGYEVVYESGAVFGIDVNNDGIITITNRQLTTSLEILKLDANGMTIPLEGAAFELRRIDPFTLNYLDEAVIYPETTRPDKKTGADGKATFLDLTSGYYEVKETVTPPGYILTGDGKIYIHVADGAVAFKKKDQDGNWVMDPGRDKLRLSLATENAVALANVGNTPGTALPNAGGPGVRLFTIFGSIMILGAGILLWRSRRLS